MNPEEPSLFNHFEDVRKKGGGESGLSAVVFSGSTTNEGTLTTSLLVHRAIVESEVNDEDCNVTGLLMGQGNGILHLLEGPSDSIGRILRNLSQHEEFTKGVQTERIIYCVEDRPERIFPEWFSCTLQERKSSVEYVEAATANDTIFDLTVGIFEVGKILQTTPHEHVQMSKYADKLPGKNLIISCSKSDEFFELSEFVSLYTDPYNVSLESEQVWPLESLVSY